MIYSYNIADFQYGVDTSKLSEEIAKSTIIIALDYIEEVGDIVNIAFKAELTTEDKTTLDNIVSSHDARIPLAREIETSLTAGTIIQTNKKKAKGANYRIYTHNFADKTTWYQYSERVEGEVLTATDTTYTKYKAVHSYIINLEQPDMVTREHWMLMPDGSFTNRWSFKPKVYVNDMEQTEGFTINFETGEVTFDAPLTSTDEVKMDYYYATVSTFAIVPPPGKKIIIYKAKLIANDIQSFDGHVIQLDIFAGNPSMAYPIGDATSPYNQFAFRYRSLLDFVVAGDNCRKETLAMLTEPLIVVCFDYDAVIELRSDQYAGLYLSMSDDTPINTEIGIGTFQIEILDLGVSY